MKKYPKEKYPYIAIFKTIPEKAQCLNFYSEDTDEAIENWINQIKNTGIWNTNESIQIPNENYIHQFLTKEVYEFINAVSKIETTSNYREKFYIINKLKFQVIENNEVL